MGAEASAGALPLIAILRGLQPARAIAVAQAVLEAGIHIIEVPLNSPDPFASISQLASARADWLIGAGTVLHADDVRRTHAAGGRLIVAPNCDAAVIQCALQLGMQVLPGIATATEAFTAIRAGATQLKLFPALTYGPGHLKALKAVLPPSVAVFPVGGIGAADIRTWLAAGASGFGFGSELFRPQYALDDIGARARLLVESLHAASR
ncbi:MAG TPA: 2-dehydro-3-deoxy-6-phosphogalactonate aldolase [Steroidobacteraceae bacterium]|nr:2-dehydro-3-deoxy-6-phosphogalactonate aldolase [Steroidobacteraceae bacterium]